MLSFDATRLHQHSTLAMGCFDRDNEYLVLGMRKVEAKSGIELAAVMMAMIEEHPGLKPNIKALMTDRAPAQVLANEMVTEMINRDRAPEDHCFVVSCLMHTALNADKRSNKKLSTDAHRVQNALKMTFGTRKQDVWRKHSLSSKLREIVGASEFRTDIGSRYKVAEQNGKALIVRETEVDEVLKEHGSTKVHRILREYMDDDEVWPKMRLELQIPVIIWHSVIDDFHTAVSKKLDYGKMKDTFNKALRQIDDIKRARSPFERALSIAQMRQYNEDSLTVQALALTRPLWTHAIQNTPAIAEAIESAFGKAFKEVDSKFRKDYGLMDHLPITDDTVLCWTNRRIVSGLI